MRASLLAAGSAAFLVFVIACSSTTVVQGSSSGQLGDASTDGGPGSDDGATADGSVEPPADGKAPSKVNVTTENVVIDAKMRSYVLAVPKSYSAAKTYPLVLVFHGDGGDGAGMRDYHTLDDVTGDDAIVAYPTGNNAGWDLYTAYDQNEDQRYVTKVIDDIKGRFSVDGAGVAAVGWSKGGFLINQMSCRRPGLFRALVVHAGGAPYEESDPSPGFPSCAGGISHVIAYHGDADGSVPVSSGRYVPQFWAAKNGCNSDPASRVAVTFPAGCKQHPSCPAGKSAVYCEIPGGGHGIYPKAVVDEWTWLKSL